MANKFLDQNGLLYLWQKIVNKFVAKVDGKGLSTNDFTNDLKLKLENIEKTVIEDSLTSTSTTKALSANQGKVLNDKIENLGAGDMLKSEYDTDGNGQVDMADDSNKLGGQLPEYYAKATDIPDKISDLTNDTAVQYTAEQTLTDEQKAQARANMGAGTSDFSGSYNDLTDRLCYEKNTSDSFTDITWDGDTTSKDIVVSATVYDSMETKFYKINDTFISLDALNGSLIQMHIQDGYNTEVIQNTYDNPLRICSENGSVQYGISLVSVAKDNDTLTLKIPDSDYISLTFPETGVYFIYSIQEDSSIYVSGLYYQSTVHLAEKYIPSEIARASDVIQNYEKGSSGGVATLDENGLVPSTQLPSYVDDVIEGYADITIGDDGVITVNGFYEEETYTTEITGESGKIYIDLSTNLSYRWGGTVFVQITSSDMTALTNAEIDTILAS